jgi:hypothetical protein
MCSVRPASPPISKPAARSKTRRRWPRTKQREPLEGVVEIDQAEIPFRADNSFFDPLKSGKILIAGAVEVIDRGINQAKLYRVKDARCPKRLCVTGHWFLTSPGVRRTPGTLQATDQIFGRAVVAGIGVAPLVWLVESSRSISTS